MPNHVKNIVKITGKADDIKRIKKYLEGKDEEKRPFDFNQLIKRPAELNDTTAPTSDPNDEKNVALREKYGADNWYDWSLEHWGTKWNAYSFEPTALVAGGTDLIYDFQTAWCMPEPIAETLAGAFPEVKVEWKWADEDLAGGNCGIRVYAKGKLVSTHYGDEEFADELWGWVSDEDEDEPKHDHYKTPAIITIRKRNSAFGDTYELSYDDESWTFEGTKDEVLAELGEHLELMETK